MIYITTQPIAFKPVPGKDWVLFPPNKKKTKGLSMNSIRTEKEQKKIKRKNRPEKG